MFDRISVPLDRSPLADVSYRTRSSVLLSRFAVMFLPVLSCPICKIGCALALLWVLRLVLGFLT